MEDLIFLMTAKNIRKNKVIIIEPALCNNNIYNKSGHYRGARINRISIDAISDVNNFKYDELARIKKFFAKYTRQINNWEYLILIDELKKFFCEIEKKKVFYYITLNGKYLLVNDISINNEEKILNQGELIELIDCKVNFNSKNRNIIVSNLGGGQYHLSNNKEFKVNVIFDNYASDECEILFEYNGITIPYSSKNRLIFNKYEVIPCSFKEESRMISKLIDLGLKKIAKNKYRYIGDKDTIISADKDICVLFRNTLEEENKQPEIILNKSQYDWFDISINYEVDGKVYDLAKRIDFSSNSSEVLVDNKLIKLPDSILENKEKLVVKDGHVMLSTKNLWSLLHIAYESKSCDIPIIDYSEVYLKLNSKVKEKIRVYQEEGIKWLKWHVINNVGCCLADDMGLGKTLQIIGMLSDEDVRKILKKVLIIVPKTLIINWKREINKFGDSFNINIYHGKARKLERKFDICITTYQTAANDLEYLNEFQFDIKIFDEIQFIKNHSTKTSNRLKKIKTKLSIGMSGTPMENNIDELWNIMDITNPGMLYNKKKFCRRYKDRCNIKELNKLLNPFILRRTKDQVLKELPEKREEILYCEFNEKEKELYNAIRIKVKNEFRRGIGSAEILQGLLYLRECCCHTNLLSENINIRKINESSKMERLSLLVSNLYSAGEKVLIFSQFTKMLNIIFNSLNINKEKIFYLDGKTKCRQKVIDEFESSSKGVFLISLKAGGVGLNLTSAQNVILYDTWWNPFVEEQAIDRVYRIGQKNDVMVYKLIVVDSIEEKMMELQKEKIDNFDCVINRIENNKKIDLREVMKLI